MRLRLLAVALLVTGCASQNAFPSPLATAPTTTSVPGTVQVAAAADFPVTADPRPIVLLGSPLNVVSGYRSDDEKVTALEGRFSFTGAAPATPEPGPVALPGGAVVLPLVGVPEAVAAMSARGTGTSVLELVTAEFGTEAFRTDRGDLDLPVWRFTTAEGSVLAWPAVTPDAFWRFGEPNGSVHQATTTDGQTLAVTLPAPPAPCEGEEPAASEPTASEPVVAEPVVTESDVSVVVGLRTAGGGGEQDCARDAAYHVQIYTVKLERPLGARLLLDEQQAVIPVTAR